MVIAVVALLVAIILPAFRGARQSARATVCLGNLRQLTGCWAAYTDDYRAFPLSSQPRPWNLLRFGWGGVHWFGEDENPHQSVPRERPLNSYVQDGGDLIENRALVFRCPSDVGGYGYRTRSWAYSNRGAPDADPADLGTCYAIFGTSYEPNDWMYCQPNDRGFGWAGVGIPYPRFRPRNNESNVVVSPSRFVVLGDTGQIVGGRYPKAERYARDMWTGFWHGEEKGLLAFLDGSARLETMGTPVTATYSLFMDQSKHSSASYKSPYVP